MSLRRYWNDLISQQAPGTFDEQERIATSTNNALGTLNAERRPVLGDDWFSEAEANRNAGLQSERDLGTIKNVFRRVGQVLSATIFSVPLWAWLLAAAILFFYLGGDKMLKRKLNLA